MSTLFVTSLLRGKVYIAVDLFSLVVDEIVYLFLYFFVVQQVADISAVAGILTFVELFYKLSECLSETVRSADVVGSGVDAVGDSKYIDKRLVERVLFARVTARFVVPQMMQVRAVADALQFR